MNGMYYPHLGPSGLRISELILGTAGASELMDERTFADTVAAALDHGVVAFDTADTYDSGVAEEWLGRALRGRRDQVVVCTKVGLRVGGTPIEHGAAGTSFDAETFARGIGPNDKGLSRVHVIAAVEHSLRRLATDHVDLYQIHQWDQATPIEETLEALADLVHAGKVRYVGASRLAGWQLHRALGVSALLQLPSFVSMQVPYSMLARECEQEVLPACAAGPVGVLAFSVMAGGMLGGRYAPADRPAEGTRLALRPAYVARYWKPEAFERVDALAKLASDLGRTPAQLAVAWVLAREAVNAAIVGVDSLDQIIELLGVVENRLSTDELERLEGIASR
jgi:aryl-alcohol dehydrogenase-like predicted oxidoreductase